MNHSYVVKNPVDGLYYWYAKCGAGGRYSATNVGGDYGTKEKKDAEIKLMIHENSCKEC